MKRKYCTVFAFLVWGCHSQSNSANTNSGNTAADSVKHTQANAKPIEKGMTDTVFCTADPSQRYAVYVPASYDAKKKWPIIYFFDPHGVGNVPLVLYKALADKYGYILAGTYNSKNGMQWTESEKAAQAFMQDSWQRLSIDNSRIYTFGFSGGARVASSVALYDGGVTGVVACGGGFPEKNPEIKQSFTFLGFVGERDFNYTEMNQLDKQLEHSPLIHQLIVYHGKHQWPPADVAEQVFQWHELNAMKMKFIPKNDSLIKVVQEQFIKEAERCEKQKNEVAEYFTYKKMLNFIGDMADVGVIAAKVQQLEKSDKISKYLADEEENLEQEMQVEKQFINYLSDKDIDWWTSTISDMRNFIKKDSLAPIAQQNQRLLSYLSLATYMGASQAFKEQNNSSAAHFLDLYKMVDPTNPEHSYLYACMYARANNTDKALNYLEDAIKLGFIDVKRAEADSNFAAIKDNPAFIALLKKMQAAPAKIDMTQ